MFENLRQRGERYSMVFNDHDRASNSYLALLAGEFAQDIGRFEEFHENVFRAFFTDLKDIGRLDVILEIASNSGLNLKKLKLAFSEGRHQNRLDTVATEARRLGILSIPAFVFENDEIITGVLPPEIFRKALEGIQNGTYVNPLV
jgi:predicted DsbA family dithiol-disulfide isomerase